MKALKLTGLLLLGSAISALAIPKDYTIGGGSTVTGDALSDPGLVAKYAFHSSLVGSMFTLNDGGSEMFKFFKIWTDESDVGDDDKVAQSITATLDFSDPSTGAAVTGVTIGGSWGFAGFHEYGKVTWGGPAIVVVADRAFSVSLNDAVFNEGDWWSTDPGKKHGAWIKATVTQLKSRSVPDGGITLMLLGLGLSGLAVARRRFLKTA